MNRSEAGKLGAIKTHQILQDRYKTNPRYCHQCKVELPYEKRKNRFCDQSCAARYNNSKKEHRISLCLNCGCEIYDAKCWQKRKYCSSRCQSQYRWKQVCEEIVEQGVVFPAAKAKRFLVGKSGHKCEICGGSHWLGEAMPLILDHIDGNAENWNVQNLRLICPNCDTFTPTYKGRNRGNGRHARRERYRQGKSY